MFRELSPMENRRRNTAASWSVTAPCRFLTASRTLADVGGGAGVPGVGYRGKSIRLYTGGSILGEETLTNLFMAGLGFSMLSISILPLVLFIFSCGLSSIS